MSNSISIRCHLVLSKTSRSRIITYSFCCDCSDTAIWEVIFSLSSLMVIIIISIVIGHYQSDMVYLQPLRKKRPSSIWGRQEFFLLYKKKGMTPIHGRSTVVRFTSRRLQFDRLGTRLCSKDLWQSACLTVKTNLRTGYV